MQKITEDMLIKAARNAKHVPVRALDLKGLVFIAKSQSHPTRQYRVRLMRDLQGGRHWECECRGFEHVGYCKHSFAAYALVIAIKAQRDRAQKEAA